MLRRWRRADRSNKQSRNNWKRTLRTELVPQKSPKAYPKQQKEPPKVSKFIPGDHPGAQKQGRVAQDQKKSNLGVWVHPRSCQKSSKFDLLETPKRLKMKRLNQAPKNKEVGHQFEAQERAFESPKWTSLGHM